VLAGVVAAQVEARVVDHHFGATARKLQRIGAAQATPGAADDGDAFFQAETNRAT